MQEIMRFLQSYKKHHFYMYTNVSTDYMLQRHYLHKDMVLFSLKVEITEY